MKKRLLALSLALILLLTLVPMSALAAGNGVAINKTNFPDKNFRAYVQQFDTDGDGYLSDEEIDEVYGLYVTGEGIKSLTGIEYFTNLIDLDCGSNQLTSLPTLPASLEYLYCYENKLEELPSLPDGLKWLDCYGNSLTSLPKLPASLEYLYCHENKIDNLPSLPDGLIELYCWSNSLTSLPTLPASLEYLHCWDNQLTTLPKLPEELSSLECGDNQLTSLPETLPTGLTALGCGGNEITTLPELPKALVDLHCGYNQLTALPDLPNGLEILDCSGNQLMSLPQLPEYLTYFDCGYNQLTSLLELPDGLVALGCDYNGLTELPSLPASLSILSCGSNYLTSVRLNAYAEYEIIYVGDNYLPSKAAVTGQNIKWDEESFIYGTQKVQQTDEPEVTFTDVKTDDYCYDAVQWAVANKITNGMGNNTFAPDKSCSRAEVVTFLWRAAGEPNASATVNFTDVKPTDYFYKAVQWAVENKITTGAGNNKFLPNDTCTRSQVVTFLWRANGSPIVSGSGFADVASNEYYANAVSWAVSEKITTGTGNGKFSPDMICTRGQVVTFLFRAQ